MSDWAIRRATLEDAAPLGAAIRAAYAIYADRIDDLPDVAGGIETDIGGNQVFVAEKDGRIGGGIVLTATDNFLLLANIAVAPEFGGQGLGRRLMNLAEEEARRQNYTEMRLSTHYLMPDNVALYIHLGWQEVGRSGSKIQMYKAL